MAAEVFGRTKNGETVHRATLEGGGLTARVMTWGAALQDLRLDGHVAPLTLGFPDFESYPLYSPYFGQTPGRIANRIDQGRFTLDGREYQLEQNEGTNHLHGGKVGLGRSVWSIEDLGPDRIRLTATQNDGDAGYPGNCTVSCTYRLHGDAELSIVFESTTDRPTICNIAHHSYFNLDGSPTILDHEAMIAADAYLPTRPDLIPTGEVAPVEGTSYDFREMRPIRCDAGGSQVAYDNNFCLSRERTGKRSVALVRSLRSGVNLEVRTTEPGVQLYTAHKIKPTVPGLSGGTYGPFAGFCLETQSWPDAPNHDGFPSIVLRPGETVVQETDYVFTRE